MSTEDELSKLFRAERAVRPPSVAAEHGWQRLAEDLAANVPALPVASGALKLGLAVFPKWALAGFAIGLAGASATASLLAPRTSPRAVPTVMLASSVHVSARSVTPAPVASATPTFEAAPQKAPDARALEPAHSAVATIAAGPATFDAELALISSAKADLDAHRSARAQASLAEHAARFPNGVFATERDALNVLAACQQGPKNPALASQFAAQHPSSALLDRLERACAASARAAPSATVDFSKLPNEPAPPVEPTTEPKAGKKP